MVHPLSFHYGNARVDVAVSELILIGFGGRDPAHVRAHIAEMAMLGVEPPPHAPCFYPVNPALLTQDDEITVYGDNTAAEVEFVFFASGGQQFVTVGNDQFDLEIERLGLAEKSKNLCMKSLAREVWALRDVLEHWDELQLLLVCNGHKIQEASVRELMHPQVLLDLVTKNCGASDGGRVVFSGTIPLLAKAPPTPYKLEIILNDPVRSRAIRHEFRVNHLRALGNNLTHTQS
ncbi:MAG: DUF2848 family protein [Aestuariivirga sp.]